MEREQISYAKNSFKSAGIVSGINQLLGGLFSAIGPAPLSCAAGFIASSKVTGRSSYLVRFSLYS
jgi:xanthine/uracil permease